MAAGINREAIRGVVGGTVEAVANIFLVRKTLVDNAVGENKEVGGKGEGPGARNGCCTGLVTDVPRIVA